MKQSKSSLLTWVMLKRLFHWRNLLKIGIFIGVIAGGNFLSGYMADQLRIELRPSNEDQVHRIITLCAIVYCLLIAIPYVPGVEIGLALIAIFGSPIVFLVYVTTVIGLMISFTIGQFVPNPLLVKVLRSLRAYRISDLVEEMFGMTRQERLEFLGANASNRFAQLLLKNRYVALVIIINLPGSFLIGGGGGISMMAGVSRLFSFPGFLLAMAVAVSPIPLFLMLFGYMI